MYKTHTNLKRQCHKSHLDATERTRTNARPQYMFELCILRWISRKRIFPTRPNEKVMVGDVQPLLALAVPLAVCTWLTALREPKEAGRRRPQHFLFGRVGRARLRLIHRKAQSSNIHRGRAFIRGRSVASR